jgi:hypothetical protein
MTNWKKNPKRKHAGKTEIKLPRSGFVHLNRFLSVVPQEGSGLKIGFGFEYEIIFRIQAAGLQIK